MRKIICDLCNKEVDRAARIEVLDGKHPHNGSTMYRTIDCCVDCILELKCLKADVEFYDLVKKF